MKKWSVALAFLLFAVDSRAQALLASSRDLDPAPALATDTPKAGPVYRAGVDLVALNVVVTDARQRFVNGLSADDFAVYEDGVMQDVSFFAAAYVPLDLALLLDTSASMHDKMETMQAAAVGFAETLRPRDRVSIVDIKDSVRILQPLTGAFDTAIAAIRATTARGGTALFNGLYLTLDDMVKQRRRNGEVRRQAIAVLSDGEDTASLVGHEEVMAQAKRAGIAIYTITLKSPSPLRQTGYSGRRYFSNAEFAMKSLAQETGARSFFPAHIGELAGVYSSIADELANQYSIGYTPKNPRRDGGFRRVVVRVEDRPGVRARTRSGYLAATPSTNH